MDKKPLNTILTPQMYRELVRIRNQEKTQKEIDQHFKQLTSIIQDQLTSAISQPPIEVTIQSLKMHPNDLRMIYREFAMFRELELQGWNVRVSVSQIRSINDSSIQVIIDDQPIDSKDLSHGIVYLTETQQGTPQEKENSQPSISRSPTYLLNHPSQYPQTQQPTQQPNYPPQLENPPPYPLYYQFVHPDPKPPVYSPPIYGSK